MATHSFPALHRIDPGSQPHIGKLETKSTGTYKDKEAAEDALAGFRERLEHLQEVLYAENKHAVLVVLQAMDAGGKDGTLRHVFAGINPQGCKVTSFKVPVGDELEHDYLWRIHQAAPGKGEIGVFNRSHYEDVLVVRVHGNLDSPTLQERYEQINAFEKHLSQNGTLILKFFLHISKDEQKERLQARIEDPEKHWKVNPKDLDERKKWNDYQQAYQDVLRHCSTEHAPWYVIPADRKWYRNAAIAQILVEALEGLEMKYPKPTVDVSQLTVE